MIARSAIGLSGISLAFGPTIVAAAYGPGAISGAHLNPSVSLSMMLAGRMSTSDLVGYAIAQGTGAIAGPGFLLLIASGKAGYLLATNSLGQNGFCAGNPGEVSMSAALVFEVA